MDNVPWYAVCLIAPWNQFLAARDPAVAEFLRDYMTLDPRARMPISIANELLDMILQYTQDPYLGLKVGRTLSYGDTGTADYVIGSAATVEDAIRAACRYVPLVCNVVTPRLDVDEARAIFCLESKVLLRRAAEDVLVSAMFSVQHGLRLHEARGLECWFSYERPENLVEYQNTFPNARLRFGMPHAALAFDREHLRSAVETADAKLHPIMREYADSLLLETSTAPSLTERVRRQLAQELDGGNPTAANVSRHLRMSVRTLNRKLEHEGTTFNSILEDMRKRLALSYLARADMTLSRIAFDLGFSHVSAFHRAFKRWTGKTPLEHRQSLRATPVDLGSIGESA
jgi:AraC-like DNA-binding protein